MITIRYSPLRTHLLGDIPSELEIALEEHLSYEASGAFFSPRVASNEWDGKQHFYSMKTRSFKSGLTSKVIRFLESHGQELRFLGFPEIERREQRGAYELRPHQEEGVSTMFQRLRGIVQSPPRSGKTMIACAFLDQSRLFPAVFMCNSIDIASQTRKVFEKFIPGAHIGLVGDGEFDLGDVTIMTVQSAVSAYEIEYKNRRKAKRESQGNAYKKIGSDNEVTNAQRAELQRYVDTVQTVIYDECHHAQSSIASTVFRKFRHAQVMFGLSATPNYGRPEDMQIEAELGEIIYGVSYSFLIEQGWLLPPKIYIYKLPRVKYSAASYQTIYREAISQNEFRNTLIARIAEKLNLQGMTVLIVVDKKTHGNEIAKYIKRTHAIRLYGEASLEERNQVKAALNAGRVKCVISTLWDEGVDIAGLHFVINAAGGMSPVDTFQRLRSITPNPDDPKKTYGGLIDFGHKEMYLMSHSKFREKQYRSEPRFDIHEINVGKWTLEDVRKSFK